MNSASRKLCYPRFGGSRWRWYLFRLNIDSAKISVVFYAFCLLTAFRSSHCLYNCVLKGIIVRVKGLYLMIFTINLVIH